MTTATIYQRDKQTAKTACGVRIQPGHWASTTIHAFRTWTGETALVTWCGIDADTTDGARLTTDTITCVQCPQASIEAFRRG